MDEKPKPKDLIRVLCDKFAYEGHLIPRPDSDDGTHITIKLKSGYDIGIKKEKIKEIKILQKAQDKPAKTEKYPFDTSKPSLTVLATGGTIASKLDYITGGVNSAFSANQLISAVPEMKEFANLKGEQVFNKFSEDMQPKDWPKLAMHAYNAISKGINGIIITHGTDTMSFSSAALSFMLKTPIPVIFTGAQRSSDRGSSDAAMNMIHAALVASSSDISGVFVCMHAGPSDTISHLHWGNAVRKLHSSRRDAFKSVNRPPAATIGDEGVKIHPKAKKRGGEAEIDTRLCEDVSLIKYYPGMTSQYLASLLNGQKGAIIEGTGLGHIANSLIPVLKQATDDGKIIYMASQTVHGRVNMNVYSTGRRLLKANIGSCRDMTAETAYVKMMCALGREKDQQKAIQIMDSDLAGEFWDCTPL